MLLKRHGIKPWEINRLTEDFLEELLAADKAEDDHLALLRNEVERKFGVS